MKKKVVLGLSGGVDSSVSAFLLREQGYDVTCLFMKNWDETDENGTCTAFQDSEDAMRVAGSLGLSFYTVNFEKQYWDKVFTYFLRELESGRTPNPDVMCNQEIKFNAFLDFALKIEADYIAMGHYAQVVEDKGSFLLARGADVSKDQSYFLSRINEKALSKVIFPIGHLEKKDVRKIAEEQKLVTAKKKDSTGICFIGERNFDAFIDKYLLSKEGDIVDVDGGVVGKHRGLIHYTLGQRKGIGIGGVKTGEPWFVVDKDQKNNILYVCQGESHNALYSNYLICEDFKWISGKAPDLEKNYTAKFRYRQADNEVKLSYEGEKIRIDFKNPVKAVTPGQIAVIYDKEFCLGGGIIEKRGNSNEL